MARSQSAGVNAYLNTLNPFSDWSWGAYFHEVGQFGIGEGKGFVNFAAGRENFPAAACDRPLAFPDEVCEVVTG